MPTGYLHPTSSHNRTSSQAPRPKLLEQVRHQAHSLHYSIRTEEAYVNWVRRFVLFHSKQHPSRMGEQEVEAFLSHLAVEKQVAASTQNQARSPLLFLYREVLGIQLPGLNGLTHTKRAEPLPVVLTKAEVQTVLRRISGVNGLLTRLLYGDEIVVREAKGNKDRIIMLPARRGRTEYLAGIPTCGVNDAVIYHHLKEAACPPSRIDFRPMPWKHAQAAHPRQELAWRGHF